MRRKRWNWILLTLVILVVYAAGPNPPTPEYRVEMPSVPAAPTALEQYVQNQEAAHPVKPDNQARIIWNNDSSKTRTPYALVYLHGFSASQFEGAPAHEHAARAIGANLYLSRLAEHGLDTADALINLTPDKYWESAKQALAIGKQLGDKVILMGTSTGASNALQLAATYPDDVAALILLSPNIAINDPNAWLLNNPWGLQIARLVLGSDYRVSSDTRPVYKQYWTTPYRIEAAVALEEMLETSMQPELFTRVKQPVLLLYYYKNEAEQDPVVKVSAMRTMFQELGTPANLKTEKAMPQTGDHVIASPLKSADAAGVEQEIITWLKQRVGNP